MADLTTKTVLSVCATSSNRLKDLEIKNGQLIFVQDKERIAFDFGGKRKFYNQIEELNTDKERVEMTSPVNASYYFVVETAVLWTYRDEWIQLTTPPEEIVFIGTEIPELGIAKTLYVNKKEKEISVWDEDKSSYLTVSNATGSLSKSNIDLLFA